MITEKITLLDGLEYEGVMHREMEVRPQKIRDSIDALEDDRAQRNEAYLGLAVLAGQIIRFGSIPKDKINTALLLDLSDDDMIEIKKGLERLRNRLKSFRDEDKNSPDAGSGARKSGSAKG